MGNVIGTLRHSMTCKAVASQMPQDCDCSPVDDAKAMKAVDALRVFAPLPAEEAAALSQFIDEAD